MPDNPSLAENAANEVDRQVVEKLKSNESFIVEAGAGAGKTYSLKKALRHVIDERGLDLIKNNQQVACITYTEAATDELRKDLDNNSAAWISTIHSFCWSLLNRFQSALRSELTSLPAWSEKLAEMDGTQDREVTYDQGYRKYDDKKIYLHHDDIPELMALFLAKPKFVNILASRFPIVFIDEYQDTNESLMESLKDNIMTPARPIILGLFGDHWQRIYDGVCGEVEHPRLQVIKKHANFRSDKKIVDALNKMRPELEQEPNNTGSPQGEIRVYHTNSWNGIRGTGAHKGGSISDQAATGYFNTLQSMLAQDGWDLSAKYTKFLLLTNTMLAKEQGYENLLNSFPYPYTDRLMQKGDDYIAFFADTVEPAVNAYQAKEYGEMFRVLGKRLRIKNHAEKRQFADDLDRLIALRATGTIKDVISLLTATKHPRIPERIYKLEEEYEQLLMIPEEDRDEDQQRKIDRLTKLHSVAYREVVEIAKYIDGKTPFSTKHKVKGAEFENVVIVFSQGWSKYNFNKMLSWKSMDNVPATDRDRKFFEDNRNLFYVVCSRPRTKLALLFTHDLSVDAISTLKSWFGEATVTDLALLESA